VKVGDKIKTVDSLPLDSQDTGIVLKVLDRHKNGLPKTLWVGWDSGVRTSCPAKDVEVVRGMAGDMRDLFR